MTERLRIGLRWLAHGRGLTPPDARSAGAAGADLRAAIEPDAVLTIAPGARALVPCGFAIALPQGYEGQVRPRSGLALNAGVTVLNAPGTIDPDYRGEVKVILANFGSEPYTIKRGDRIAQLVVAPVAAATFYEMESLDETDRGSGGFGSTGR